MGKMPERTCMGCRSKKNKTELIRIVKNKNNEITIDKTGKKEGRGAYICRSAQCLEKAIHNKSLDRIFEIKINEDIYNNLRGVIIDKTE